MSSPARHGNVAIESTGNYLFFPMRKEIRHVPAQIKHVTERLNDSPAFSRRLNDPTGSICHDCASGTSQ